MVYLLNIVIFHGYVKQPEGNIIMIYYVCDACKMLQLHYNHYIPPNWLHRS